jgi:hypothetical protein
MSTDEVRRILGAPLEVVTASEMTPREANADFNPDLKWNYYMAPGDTRVLRRIAWVEFRSGRVGRVQAGAKYIWNRSWANYLVGHDGVSENPEFKSRFCGE